MTSIPAIHGFTAPGFEPVREEFGRNFAERGELGAAFAVVLGNDLVVDLWGGDADRPGQRAWTADTLQLIFSGTKGLVATTLLLLIDRGLLQLDAPVCRYWPEFSEGGKEKVSVRQVVTHSTGLPGITERLTARDVLNDRLMAELLARQEQIRDPRAGQTYHALTYGWLCGELVRRIDGRSVGRLFAEDVARPLGLQAYIGLPAELEHLVSHLELAESWGVSPLYHAAGAERDELIRMVWGNPVMFARHRFPWNDSAYHAAEIPGANGIGTARSIARLYASLHDLVSADTLNLARTELERRQEPLLQQPQAFGIGFALQTQLCQFGPPADAFGHAGAGGSVHGAWPSHNVGFSYTMNLMRDDSDIDPRAEALLNALHECIVR